MFVLALLHHEAARAAGWAALAAMLAVPAAPAQAPEPHEGPPTPPVARRDDYSYRLHGVAISDPYRWLEDQHSPETRAWIEAENIYTESVLGRLPQRAWVAEHLRPLLQVEEIGLPIERGDRFFYLQRAPEQPQATLYMRQGATGAAEAIIDPNQLDPRHTTSVTLDTASDDGRLLAYGLRAGGRDETTLHLYDVARRRELPETFPSARYMSVAFTPENDGLYYVRYLPAAGPRLFLHHLGSEPSADRELFGQDLGADKAMSVELSEDGRYLLLTVFHGSGSQQTELYYQDRAGHGPITPLVNDIVALFHGQLAGSTVYIDTNWQAPNHRILAVDLHRPERHHWRVIVAEDKNAVIEGFAAAGGHLFVNYLENVRSRVAVLTAQGRPLREIAFPALGTVSRVVGRWSDPRVFYEFSSFAIPPTIYEEMAATGEQSVWARVQAPVDSATYTVEQVWYRSKDGTRVPMFLAHRKDLRRDGDRPTLMTGYGGFDISLTPGWNPVAVLWAELGGVFAVPNLRGGGELGEAWHHAGMLAHKQNVFDDFFAAAEWLIANHYTRPARLAATGRSNGGLLMGAAMTQRPDLFGAIDCGYPLLDMLRYEKFPIGSFWVPEYGTAQDPAQFPFIYAYSPYQHVQPGRQYPAILFVTGDSDTRVNPMHARKMTALMQAASGSGRPILLHYDVTEGHSGGQPLAKRIADAAEEQGFLLWQIGVP